MRVKGNGLELIVDNDDNPFNPREDENLGTMLCFHRRYTLGDDNPHKTSAEFWESDEAKDIFVKVPVYMYDHSGITISHVPFNDKWDSGQLGIIYVTKEKALEEYGNLSEETKQKCEEILIEEIDIYDHYLSDSIYRFTVNGENGDELDSCGNFYDETGMKDMLLYMKSMTNKEYGFLFEKMAQGLEAGNQM